LPLTIKFNFLVITAGHQQQSIKTKARKAMNIPDDVLESFENLITQVIEHSAAPFYGLCLSKKHKKDIYISAPFFLIEAYKTYLSKKSKSTRPTSYYRFNGIKMIPSSDYAITVFHKDYVAYKYDWMIRKWPLKPGLEAYVTQVDPIKKAIVEPFAPGPIKHDEPSLN
jgi:hypothetical protein